MSQNQNPNQNPGQQQQGNQPGQQPKPGQQQQGGQKPGQASSRVARSQASRARTANALQHDERKPRQMAGLFVLAVFDCVGLACRLAYA